MNSPGYRLCCFPLELSGRRPETPRLPPGPLRPTASAGHPTRSQARSLGRHTGSSTHGDHRPHPYPPHARAPRVVCMCARLDRLAPPSRPSGNPCGPLRAELEPLAQLRSRTRKRPLNVHVGQQASSCLLAMIDPPCQRARTHQVNAATSQADAGDASAGGAQRQEAHSCKCPACTDRGRTCHPAARHRGHRGATRRSALARVVAAVAAHSKRPRLPLPARWPDRR